jgi:hypothetical protein
MRLRRSLLVTLILLLVGGGFVLYRGFLTDQRIFKVSDDDGWYVECVYQRLGGKMRTYNGGWYTRERAEEEAWCPFIRR